MSNERAELADLLSDTIPQVWEYAGAFGEIADAILAAGYQKPRQVSTVAELEELAKGSVIISHLGGVWTKYYDHFRELDNWEAKGSSYLHPDDLPATVLYEPRLPHYDEPTETGTQA